MIKNRGEIQSQYQSFSKKLTEKKEKNFNIYNMLLLLLFNNKINK